MRKLIVAFVSTICSAAYAQPTLAPEISNFIKTSTYQEVMDFLNTMQSQSGNLKLISMGQSTEGKNIPVAVLANPAVSTPAEAKASGKLVVYIQGNIHGGEVEGKEAVMMLMRDILLGEKKNLLANQIILFAPIYNTDGNDKMAKGRRPSQEDSPLEVGTRENGQSLDLNRDGMKMEAPETNGLFQNIIVPWDPQLFVDLHTTNGTWHAWNLTWAPSYHYAGEYAPYDLTMNKMLPAITRTVKEKYDLNFGPYGDYDVRGEGWPVKNFYTYDHQPRYLVNQFGLRNRMAILSEAFAHERFYQRIFSTYAFITEILEYTNANVSEIFKANKTAEENAIRLVNEQAGKAKKGVRFKMVPLQKLDNFITYDYVTSTHPDGSKTYLRTGKIVKVSDVNYYAKFEPTLESTLPRGYVIPAAFKEVVENLTKHGIKVTTLDKSKSFSGEVFLVEKLEKAKVSGWSIATLKGSFSATTLSGKFNPSKKKFNKGDFVVDLAQPLGNLAFYLLEPQSDDGLTHWNFFDEYLQKQGAGNKAVDFPVFKYY